MFRLITFASAHPGITDGQPLSTEEIVDLLLHGIGSQRTDPTAADIQRQTQPSDQPLTTPAVRRLHPSTLSRDRHRHQPVHPQPVGAR